MNGKYYYGTGRRKSSVARVFLTKGTGQIIVNGRPVDEFFARETSRMVVRQPLVLTENAESFDIKVNVTGGGETGQSGAIRHGITRALIDFDAALKPALSQAGLLLAMLVKLNVKTRFAQSTSRKTILQTLIRFQNRIKSLALQGFFFIYKTIIQYPAIYDENPDPLRQIIASGCDYLHLLIPDCRLGASLTNLQSAAQTITLTDGQTTSLNPSAKIGLPSFIFGAAGVVFVHTHRPP